MPYTGPVTPLVSAIVLNYRTGKDAWACVQGLLAQTVADRLEILVVDNHSEDDSVGYLRNAVRRVRGVRVLESARNIGYGQGNALAIRQALGTYILITNPDNVLERDGLEKMVAALERDPSIGILAPQLVHEDGSIRDSFRRFPTMLDLLVKRTPLRRWFGERVDRYLQHGSDPMRVQDVDWVVGACLLLRRDLYESLGGFDPRFFLFFEDTDLCRRCKNAGKRVVYYPEVRAADRKQRLSEGGFSSLLTKPTVRIHLQSAIRYFWKWRKA
jgi:N-acetylglucosaminyl-diphospho-decaprenol L-rhamnosyltransferase